MREVAVLGIGQTKIEEHWEKSLRDLAGEAIMTALENANLNQVDGIFVGNMMSGTANRQQHLGAYIADWVGLRLRESIRLESACSSGAAAFRAGLLAIAAGDLESALIVGVEKMSDSPITEITSSLVTAADADWEIDTGVSFVALNALIMQRYMHEYHWSHKDFAGFSINAHANAIHNPYARLQMPITLEQYEKASMIVEPINLLDASPTGDGAAAIVLVSRDQLQKTNASHHIVVAGSAAATDAISIHNRRDPLWLKAAELSAKRAYTQTGITPNEIDFFEYHDAFTIMGVLSLEASGFIGRGQGPRMALENKIKLNGELPTATLGGLKARGHPVGATGMYQLVEVVQQLRGQAGENQLDKARIGMAQNIGGSGSNIITHILISD